MSSMISLPDNLFLMEPRNRDFLLGKRKNPAGFAACSFILLLTVWLMFLAVTVGVTGLYIFLQVRDNQLNTQGIIIRGNLTDRHEYTDSDDDTSYYLTYAFTVDNQTYTREAAVSYDDYQKAEIGGGIDVTYLPDDPSVSRIPLENGFQPLVIFVVVWDGIVAVFFVIGIINYRQSRQLTTQGQVIYGELVECSGDTDSDGDYSVKVVYAFRAPTTREYIEGKTSSTRNDLKKEPLPKHGVPIAVLFASPKLYRLL